MRIGQRLFVAVLPAIVGLLTVSALVYFGEYAREAPEWLVLLAVSAALGSGVLAWTNARYIARRVAQLADRREHPALSEGTARRVSELLGAAIRPRPSRGADGDELDRIEQLLVQLTDTLSRERIEHEAREESWRGRAREYASLIRESVGAVRRQADEVRLPLHILLENRFGELNENQEEMLAAARAAAEAIDGRLERLDQIVQLDGGALPLRIERVRVQELVANLRPALETLAAQCEVQLTVDLTPSLPAIDGDRVRLQGALATLLQDAVCTATPGATVRVSAIDAGGYVELMIAGGGTIQAHDGALLARRVIGALAGSVDEVSAGLRIRLPTSAT